MNPGHALADVGRRGAISSEREQINMNSKLKALGLALFAAFALSAVAAASASAVTHHFTLKENATVTAKALTPQVFKAETESTDNVTCKEVTATGNLVTTQSEITATPTYTECTAEKGGPPVLATVENGGCDFRFTGTTTSGNPTNGEHATVHIVNHAEPGKECHFQIKVTALKLKCISVPNQEVKDAVTYTQSGEGTDVVVKATVHGLKSTTTNSAACPTPGGVTVVHENGTYSGEVTVKAHNNALEPVPITLNQTP